MFRSTPIGFQYELLNALANGLDMKLDLTINGNPDEVYPQAFGNHYDIVAMDFKKNHFVAQLLTLSLPHSQSHPVLIERVPEKDDSLFHRILYVPAQFSAQISTDSLPDPSSWVTAYSSELTTEDLFDLLQKKKMDYIVSDYQTAITLLPFFPDLEMSKQIGEDFDRSWVLNDYNDSLNLRINNWLAEYKQSKEYEKLCKKYFSPHSKVLSYTSPQKRSKRISPYDRELKKYAKPQGIDWRLVASIIYQESKFQCNRSGAIAMLRTTKTASTSSVPLTMPVRGTFRTPSGCARNTAKTSMFGKTWPNTSSSNRRASIITTLWLNSATTLVAIRSDTPKRLSPAIKVTKLPSNNYGKLGVRATLKPSSS